MVHYFLDTRYDDNIFLSCLKTTVYSISLFHFYSELTTVSRSLDPFYIESYYMNWVKTSWTYNIEIDKDFLDNIEKLFCIVIPCVNKEVVTHLT